MKYFIITLLVCLCASLSFAQTAQEKSQKKKSAPEIDRGATYQVETNKKTKKKETKNSISKQFDRKVEEYEKRMEANAKKNEKIAREMKKPQYSDPSYFGHKKKPKKRPPGKKKFCKECQMSH